MRRFRSGLLAVLCGVTLALAASPAQAAPEDPLFVFDSYIPNGSPPPPPVFPFEGPCGLAVDSGGYLYVANYYRHTIEIYDPNVTPKEEPEGKIEKVDPLDGPCGLAVDTSGIFVNNFHRNVEKFQPFSFTPLGVIDSALPTGVAIGPGGLAFPGGSILFVDARTQVNVYDAGNGLPLGTIGQGSLEEGYGLAVSAHPATSGYVYVPDDGDDTIKVFDPETDLEDPIQVIDGSDMPSGGFGSLEESAIAIDNVTGEIYVADTIGPQFSDKPKAIIHVFDASGAYEGRLKHEVIDGEPVGLTVDNSANPSQGRVYVTSGNTSKSVIYAYPPGAAMAPVAPLAGAPAAAAAAAPAGSPDAGSSADGPRGGEAATTSVITQKGNVRVAVSGRLAPKRLPRTGAAPISVSVGGKISTTDQTQPPQLRSLEIELNREGRLDAAGLPVCPYNAIQPASTSRALSACREALVGRGSFDAEITLAGQGAYPTGGTLLVFNGRQGGKQVLFGQIYATRPFATSFVIVFEIQRLGGGTYGTAMRAELPEAMGSWGNLTGIEMTLKRRYTHRGRAHSYISAGCPAPKGFSGADFPLARTTFGFEGGRKLSSVLRGTCKVRG